MLNISSAFEYPNKLPELNSDRRFSALSYSLSRGVIYFHISG
jgi:hypothetical protein